MGLYIDIVNGWQDGSIYDIPVEGIKLTIDRLREEGYEIILHSTRCSSVNGIKAVETWLDKYDIKVDDISSGKPIAMIYVDDRAIQFNGNCEILIREIHNFKTWTERAKKTCLYCNGEFFIDDFSKSRNRYCSMDCRKKAKEIRRKKREYEKYKEEK